MNERQSQSRIDSRSPRTVLSISVLSHSSERADVRLAGRFDVVEAAAVREFLNDASLSAVRDLTIDLSEVTFVDSAGLAVLARARRDVGLLGGSVTLVRPRSDDAMRVFRLTQFDQIFTMLDRAEGEAV